MTPFPIIFIAALRSCLIYRDLGFTRNGIYKIQPDPSKKPFEVWCDMTKEDGGWTVLLRRESNKVNFSKSWDEYKNGFGNLNESFWLGNQKIHGITKSLTNEAKIDLVRLDGQYFTIRYSNFNVYNESTQYTLNYGDYNTHLSNASDCFTRLKVRTVMFSTYDRDNDFIDGDSCSRAYNSAGWWFVACHIGYMTGRYMEVFSQGNTWCHQMRVIHSELKIRER